MSKRDELINLRRSFSSDASINVHGRTGETSSVSSVLDLLAHSESPEEVILSRDDEKARRRFQEGFYLYLERVFDEKEREFLSMVVTGGEALYTEDGLLRVKYIPFLQAVQRKAYENTKPLIKLARGTKWAGAEDFISTIFERLKKLNEGFSIVQVIPKYALENEKREKKRKWRRENLENARRSHREWYKRNAERARENQRKRSYTFLFKVKEKKENISRLELNSAYDLLTEKLAAWIAAKQTGKDETDPTYTALIMADEKVSAAFKKWEAKKYSLKFYKRKRGFE